MRFCLRRCLEYDLYEGVVVCKDGKCACQTYWLSWAAPVLHLVRPRVVFPLDARVCERESVGLGRVGGRGMGSMDVGRKMYGGWMRGGQGVVVTSACSLLRFDLLLDVVLPYWYCYRPSERHAFRMKVLYCAVVTAVDITVPEVLETVCTMDDRVANRAVLIGNAGYDHQ